MSIFSSVNHWLTSPVMTAYHRQCLVIKGHLHFNTPDAVNKSEQHSPINPVMFLPLFEQHYTSMCIMSDTINSTNTSLLDNTRVIKLKQSNNVLGQCFDCVVFDATAGLNMNACYAASGLVNKCGLLVLLLPPSLNDYYGAKSSSAIAFSYNDIALSPRFASIFEQQLSHHSIAHISNEGHYLTDKVFVPLSSDQPDAKINHELRLSSAQKTVFNKVVTKNDAQTIHVILGERGRGKSTLLGAICSRQLFNNQTVTITASKQSQTDVIYATANTLTLAQPQSDTLQRLSKFIPPDALLGKEQYTDVLIVDEMASIAPNLLMEIIKPFSVIVLAGTVSGYEGSGKGFMQRVLPTLSANSNCHVHQLNQPFRWFEDDPIEGRFKRLFADNIVLPNPPKQQAPVTPTASSNFKLSLKNITFVWINKDDLVNDFPLYQQIFALLNIAHYQSTPNDIVRALDSSDHHILVAFNPQKLVLGVVVGISEHSISASLGSNSTSTEIPTLIANGKRRVQGHFTAQSIALQINEPGACRFSYLRITRIAVSQQYRHQGLGKALLHQCEHWLKDKRTNMLSVSFGVNEALLQFWHQSGFTLLKLGSRVDTASGTISALMVKTSDKTLAFGQISQRCQYKVAMDNAWNKRLLVTYPDYNSGANQVMQQRYLQHYIIEQLDTSDKKLTYNLASTLCLAFVQGKLNLPQAASAIYVVLSTHAQQNDIELLSRYFEKNTHKHIKQEIASDLRNLLKRIL
ncbi:MAG: GNAT family N-acetyltransferase [Glaciecola sp.]